MDKISLFVRNGYGHGLTWSFNYKEDLTTVEAYNKVRDWYSQSNYGMLCPDPEQFVVFNPKRKEITGIDRAKPGHELLRSYWIKSGEWRHISL
jgi:hypothetical protein